MALKDINKKLTYYFCRLLSKAGLHIVGRMSARFGRVHEDYIVFKNRTMQDVTDNARAFFEYLVNNEEYSRYKIIWMVSEPEKFRSMKTRNIKFITAESRNGWTSPRAYYYGAVAGHYIYTNNTAYLNLYHCKGQKVLNMWHGCGYKDVAKEQHSAGAGKKSMMQFDCALVPGPAFIETKSRYWNCPKEKILALGYPRYDWMLHPALDRNTILKKLSGQDALRTVIWMPTFRNSDVLDSKEGQIKMPYRLPGLRNETELHELDQYLKMTEMLLIIKKHPVQSDWQFAEDTFTNIRFVTQKDLDIQGIKLYELISACDGLISDYSSVAVDYMLLDRPIAYILADMEEYRQTRGFVFEDPLKYMPGEKLYDLQGIKGFLQNVSEGKDVCRGERRSLLPVMHSMPVKESYCRELAKYLKL